MLNLRQVIKPWKESAALNAHINLFGFWNESAFLTKSGDLGMVLRVSGIDYESLDNAEQDYAVKRLESALDEVSPPVRAVLLLRLRDERPCQEIAQQLGLTDRQVKRYLARGYDHLRARLEG